MAKGKKGEKLPEQVQVDAMDLINDLELDVFVERFVMEGNSWRSWHHPTTGAPYTLTLQTSASLSRTDLDSCFNLIEYTSSSDYKKSKDGWKPRSKRKEMQLLDLKYFLVRDLDGVVKGFCSFMPTWEDGEKVVYCYEIHLSEKLQGTGLGKLLMSYLYFVADKIPDVSKIMLTVFACNERGVMFYERLGYEKDEFSPEPRVLRNGTVVEMNYLILSKRVLR